MISERKKRSGNLLKTALITAAVLCAAAVLLFILSPKQSCLLLKNHDTGRIYSLYEAEEGSTFSITFIHSVNQTPVIETYRIEDGDIYVIELKYYSYGAGMPTELEEGQTSSYSEDGGMIISGYHTKSTGMIYVVGMVSDHILNINGSEHSLRDLCGRGSAVEFTMINLPSFLMPLIS